MSLLKICPTPWSRETNLNLICCWNVHLSWYSGYGYCPKWIQGLLKWIVIWILVSSQVCPLSSSLTFCYTCLLVKHFWFYLRYYCYCFKLMNYSLTNHFYWMHLKMTCRMDLLNNFWIWILNRCLMGLIQDCFYLSS